MEKGPDAFRTISEVADDLDLPQHVLRFWETRFPQIRPLKRGGGRRYYRPDDVELLRGIRHLLYGEGYTIRGVQRILKEEGPRYVQAIWRDVEADDLAVTALEEREERAARHAGPRDAAPPDSGHPGRPREDQAPRSGPLSGILNLLPTRQRETPEEPAQRRARRRPENEPDLLELPLLPDLEPQVKPPRAEPVLRHAPPFVEPQPHQDIQPRHTQEPRETAPLPDAPPPGTRPVFPFRTISSEPAPGVFRDDDDFREDVSYVPERARPAHATPARPVTAPPMGQAPLRAGGVHDDETPARTKLSRDDVQRLQAALYELQDCRRLLDAVRDRDD